MSGKIPYMTLESQWILEMAARGGRRGLASGAWNPHRGRCHRGLACADEWQAPPRSRHMRRCGPGLRAILRTINRPFFPRFFRNFRTFLGDFNPQQLPSRGLQTLWEWKNRVLLETYYIFNVVIPLEVE